MFKDYYAKRGSIVSKSNDELLRLTEEVKQLSAEIASMKRKANRMDDGDEKDQLMGYSPHLPGFKSFEIAFLKPFINSKLGNLKTSCNFIRSVNLAHSKTTFQL
jgi:hypothetical protein